MEDSSRETSRFHWPVAVKAFGTVLAFGAVLGIIGLSFLMPGFWEPPAPGGGNEGWRFPLLFMMIFLGAFAGAVMAAIPALLVGYIFGSKYRKAVTSPTDPASGGSDA